MPFFAIFRAAERRKGALLSKAVASRRANLSLSDMPPTIRQISPLGFDIMFP